MATFSAEMKDHLLEGNVLSLLEAMAMFEPKLQPHLVQQINGYATACKREPRWVQSMDALH